MAYLEKDAEFDSFASLSEAITRWEASNFVQLYKRSSRTIQAAMKRAPKKTINVDLKFAEVDYACIHGGKKFRSASTGQRPNQSTYVIGCPFTIKVRVTPDGKNLYVKEISSVDCHNHELSQETFQNLPKQRRLTDSESTQVGEMLKMKAKKKVIIQHLQSYSGKKVTLKDINNIASRIQLSHRNNCEEPTAEMRKIEGIVEDDKESMEFSQNDEENTPNASLEQFLAEVIERDATPTPSAQMPPKPENYQLRHNNHLTIILEALASDEAFMDVTLTAQGRSLKAHKSVLSAVSPYFREVLRENPCQHPIIIMPRDVGFEELFSIVNYIYKGEMTVAAEDLTSLLKTGEILQVSGLAPSDSSATVNPHTDLLSTRKIRSASASSCLSSNHSSTSKSSSKVVKETNQGISTQNARPKSPDGMINLSDFMDMNMTYAKEKVPSADEEDDDDTAASETSGQPQENTSPRIDDTQQDSVTPFPKYNLNREQSMASSSSSQDTSTNAVKTEIEMEASLDMEHNKSPAKTPQPFVCPYCHGQHRGVDNLANHLRLNHPTKSSFICGCGRVFTRSMSHQAHVKICSSNSS